MILRSNHGWQLILADLSLILFLVTLTALVRSSSEDEKELGVDAYVAPAQALFRQVDGGPTLADWLSEQPDDPRATLTIIAQHAANDRDTVWQAAQALAQSVQGSGVPVRVVIAGADKSDLYASLAYDTPATER